MILLQPVHVLHELRIAAGQQIREDELLLGGVVRARGLVEEPADVLGKLADAFVDAARFELLDQHVQAGKHLHDLVVSAIEDLQRAGICNRGSAGSFRAGLRAGHQKLLGYAAMQPRFFGLAPAAPCSASSAARLS